MGNSSLDGPRKDKPGNTLFLLSPWVLTTRKTDTTKSKLRSDSTLSKLVSRSIPFHSSQSQDGLVTTCSKDPTTCHGTRDQSSWNPSMPSSHQRDQYSSHSDSHSKMSTRSLVSEPSQLVELRPVSSSQT